MKYNLIIGLSIWVLEYCFILYKFIIFNYTFGAYNGFCIENTNCKIYKTREIIKSYCNLEYGHNSYQKDLIFWIYQHLNIDKMIFTKMYFTYM